MNLLRTQLSSRFVSRCFSSFKDHDVVVAGFARTPIGKLGGALASINAPTLGAHAITAAVERSGLQKADIEEAFMGNVVSAGIGQAPTRQAVVYAGLPVDCPSTTINKVCASGMKATMLAALSVATGYRNCVVAGGARDTVVYFFLSPLCLLLDRDGIHEQHPLLPPQRTHRL